jgi:CelD/BcsL family acetyltransferase involved in cellulose biosynthesis
VRAYVPAGRLLLFAARADGRLAGVLPMVHERVLFSGMPVERFRGPSVLSGWRFDPVRRAGPEGDAAVTALWKFVKDFRGWDVLEFPDVVEGGAAEGFVRAAQADGFPTGSVESMHTPYIPLSGWDGTEDFWLRQTRPSFRSQIRRRVKKLTSQGPLDLRRYDAADPELLQRFYALEASGWKGREASAIANDQTRLQLFTELAREAARYGYLTLYFLEHNGHPIAADFGLTYRGRYSAPKGAYDERYGQYGPGHLLVNAVLRDCAERGLTEYNFLAHAEEWKQKWTSRYRTHAFWFVFRRGIYGLLVAIC